MIPGTHESLAASDEHGRLIAQNVAAYKKADRLDPYGFSGWIGREPHGAQKSDSGVVRDGVFAEQIIELFGELGTVRATMARGSRWPLSSIRTTLHSPHLVDRAPWV